MSSIVHPLSSFARTALTMLLAATALPALAQTGAGDPAAPAAADTAAAENEGGIDEIVVTAQRVEQRLQDVPLSVTAVTGQALRDANITDVTRLEQLVPGLRIGRSGSDARPAIRGVFTEAIGANSDPRIGFYIDDIYQSRTSQALAAFVDLNRVEVLKGPQGTLYGRNSFGGNISLYSNKPDDDMAFGVDALYGRFNRFRTEAFANLPIADGLAFRVAGTYERQDGYVKNTSTGSDLGDEDAKFVRASLRYAPSGSGLEIVLRGSYFDQGGDGISAFGYKSIGTMYAPNLIRAPGGTITLPTGRVLEFLNGYNGVAFSGGTFANAIGIPINSRFRDGVADAGGADIGVPIEADPYRINFDTDTVRETEMKQFSAHIEYDFGPVALRSITSYTDFNAIRSSDNDFFTVPVAIDYNLTDVQTFTQEVQLLSSDRGSRFQWIVGGFYFDDKIDERFFSDNFTTYPAAGQTGISLFSPTFLPSAAISNIRSDNFSPVKASTKSYAGFVQASYEIVDGLTLTGGYRYTSDEKEYAAGVGQTAAGDGFLSFDIDQRVNYACNPTGGTQLGGNNPANPRSTATNAANGIGINCGSAKFNFSTWRGAVDWKVADDNLLYASVSRGIRSGGFNNVIDALTGEVIAFLPEEVIAYEVGSKNRFLDGTLQLNLAGFYNDFKDLQVQTSVPAPNGLTVLSIVTNAGKARAYGVEVEALVKPSRAWTFQIAFNYLNAKDTEFVTGTFGNGLCGIVAGGCPAATLPANPTPADIAAFNAALQANAFGLGPQGAPFPNPVTDPNLFTQVFLPNGAAGVSGATLPIYNYIIAGKLADGTRRTSPTVFSPEFSVQLGASYDFEIDGVGTFTPSVQSYFSSDFINTAFTPDFGNQDAYTKTDLRLTFVTQDNRFSLQGYIENIEDAAVLHRVAYGGNRSLNAIYGLPLTWGFKAGVRF